MLQLCIQKIGTLDTLVLLSEDLAKQDTAFESSANKIVDIIRSLLGSEAATKLAGSLSVNESMCQSIWE